ncbi:hypothetical protein C2R22_05925 [Salinigranum rubrum]|uniref:Uncharacterized protein n=1 Tax=Salinigranum rubrum TaxID=755307 RepID=A0A2I8VH45_9EURY|nr:hypothetical protein [Salinigranum rubrum]AUV81256.1 hypothetical protein C2R22_05925 [Salinigranum rubrum]
MSHRQRDTHTATVTRPSDTDGESDFMGAPVQDDSVEVATLSVRVQSPAEAGNLGTDAAGEVVTADKVVWTSNPEAAQVQVDDHLTLDRVGPTDPDGEDVYLVQQVREQFGRRVSQPELWVFDCDRYTGQR